MSFNISRRSSTQKGFTLLEMLLVIAIIAILAAIVIVAINPARQLAQARNAQRASDLNALYKATQQYLIDNNGVWPEAASLDEDLQEICGTGGGTSGCVDLTAELVPDYIAALPQNPDGGNYHIAIRQNKPALMAPGSTENDLVGVVIGNVEQSEVSEGEEDPEDCSDLTGDDRRVCDLAAIHEAIEDYIADNDHAPYLGGGCTMENGQDDLCIAYDFSGSWDILAGELADYIDPLPVDPCGEDCYYEADGTKFFFSYGYAAPGELVDFCADRECVGDNTAYGLHAEQLEDEVGGRISYGFGSW